MSKKRKPLKHGKRIMSYPKQKEAELNRPYFRMDDIYGVWRSFSIFPTLLIYKDHSKYKLCIMQTDDVGQVQPEIFILAIKEENECTLIFSMRDITIKYNNMNDILSHGEFGNYFREYK